MALGAFIAASRQIDEGEGLRATLALAGRTLLEHQVRLAARAGAGHIVILVERLPAALIGAVDRLRRDGITIHIARSLPDAVDRVHPDERLLLFGDGVVCTQAMVDRLAALAAPAMLTVPDDADHAAFERIDGSARWAGLLLTDGDRLRRTAAMLGEWDLESTLLRDAVQAGAARIPAVDPHGGDGAQVRLLGRPGGQGAIERSMIAASRAPPRDLPGRLLYPAFERLVLPVALRRGADPFWVGIGGVALAFIAVIAMAVVWPLTALGLLLASGFAASFALRLADVRLGTLRHARPIASARCAGAVLVLLLLGRIVAAGAGWGVWPLCLLILLPMAALVRERTALVPLASGPPLWLATPDALAWLLLPFAIAGHWLSGLCALALYACASFLYVQSLLVRAITARQV